MNQVTTKKEGALAVNIFEADANQGAQNIAQDDLALPFLKVLGQLSPEINKTHSKYIKGAEAGMILNSVSGELFDGEEGIEVLPVFYKRQYIEWQDRGASTGAPVAIHEADSDIIKNEINVSFGRNEDNKAAEYAELARSQGLQPTQKMKVEPMTLKALVRERIEAGKEMPTEIFSVYTENKTTIKRNK